MMMQQTDGPEFFTWNTADFWPDWSAVEECTCGLPLSDIPDGADSCPKCGQDMLELVYPHCASCGEMIVGEVWTSEFGDDYHPGCGEPIEL